jgi:hypothetical protein
MPDQEVAYLDQTAIVFPRTGYGPDGQPTVGPPYELTPPLGVRWLTKRTEVLDAKGNTIMLDGTAITAQPVLVGSWMWLGSLSAWYGTGSAYAALDQELMEVKYYNETPDLKNRASFHTIGLMRLHNRAPD